ncbi:MAG: hypothetical protein HOV81_04515 [Kofleriaceae bacterium]|nr:hypothetical protein [Kofleriaceae bacterium]
MRTNLFLLLFGVAACASTSPKPPTNVHSNGQVRWEYKMVNGVPHGPGHVYYADGTLKSEGEYVNGVKHGLFKFYRPDGELEQQTYFYKNVAVWKSTDPNAEPPDELISGLTAFSGEPPKIGDELGVKGDPNAPSSFRLSYDAPEPYFSSLDRTAGPNRLGVQFGAGTAGERPFGSVTRYEVFGSYRFADFGAYGSFAQSQFEVEPNMRLSGRQTLELGGTYQRPVALGPLSVRGGILFPISSDDADGYLASTAGAMQRATDAAQSFPSTVAVRTSASITHKRQRLVLQGDGGIDWLLGGPNSSLDALARLNAGVGLGFRSLMVGVEVANTLRMSEPSRHIHVMGVSGTFWINHMWVTGFAASSLDGETSVTGALGYEL